jgi:3-hydroxyacyl-CoA dehydrogenase
MHQVTVAGSGVLGSQIAFQCAFKGCDVRIYDIDPRAIAQLPQKWRELSAAYRKDLKADDAALSAAVGRLRAGSDLAEAVQGSDLVIEAVPESVTVKRSFYEALSIVAPKTTIFATNSSTLLPSALAQFTDRPERFLALHFASRVWRNNIAEVMRHSATDGRTFDDVIAFAERIGMVPIALHKEQPGYVINTLLIPWVRAGMSLVVKGVASPHDVDRTWMIAGGGDTGPFAVLDLVGLRTPLQILNAAAEAGDAAAAEEAKWLRREYIDRNKLGIETGEGFYKYPNPAYRSADFVRPRATKA